ncbi:hypothetical protein QTO30_14705 [Yoonia sp. GPGPB17]|uniref:hypothetical protein n=1 Tax=Yoonia sp. GPGPB17 TaxID=3026147 RepID=UPI0030BAAD82
MTSSLDSGFGGLPATEGSHDTFIFTENRAVDLVEVELTMQSDIDVGVSRLSPVEEVAEADQLIDLIGPVEPDQFMLA